MQTFITIDYLHEPPGPPPAASPFDMPLVNCNGNVSNKILQPHLFVKIIDDNIFDTYLPVIKSLG